VITTFSPLLPHSQETRRSCKSRVLPLYLVWGGGKRKSESVLGGSRRLSLLLSRSLNTRQLLAGSRTGPSIQEFTVALVLKMALVLMILLNSTGSAIWNWTAVAVSAVNQATPASNRPEKTARIII